MRAWRAPLVASLCSVRVKGFCGVLSIITKSHLIANKSIGP